MEKAQTKNPDNKSLPRFIYKIDLQKLISGEYVHTILTDRWLAKYTDNKKLNHLKDTYPDIFDMVKTDNNEIYFTSSNDAKRYIKIISSVLYQTVTYIKILKLDTVSHTKTIGFALNVSDYKNYAEYKQT